MPGAPLLGRREAAREELEQGREMAVGLASLAGLGDAGDRRVDRLAVGGDRLRLAVGAQRCSARRGRAARPARCSSASARSTSSRLGSLSFSSASASRGRRGGAAERRRGVGAGGSGQARLARRRGCAARRGRRRRSPAGRRCRRRRPAPPRSGRAIPSSAAVGEELLERLVEGLARGPLGLGRVEHAEAGVDPGRDRVRREQPVAEAVDRRHPGAADRRSAARRRARSRPRPGAPARRGSAAAARPRPCR